MLHTQCSGITAVTVLSEARGRVEGYDGAQYEDVSRCCPASSADHLLFTESMRVLAELCPHLFGPKLSELGERPRGDALAFLLVSERWPRGLARYRGGRARERVQRAREVLQAAVAEARPEDRGVAPDFTAEPDVYIVREGCPLLHV